MEKLTTYVKGLFRDGAWIWTIVLLLVVAVFLFPLLVTVRGKLAGLPLVGTWINKQGVGA